MQILGVTRVTDSQIITQDPIIFFYFGTIFFVTGTIVIVRAINRNCFKIKQFVSK